MQNKGYTDEDIKKYPKLLETIDIILKIKRL